MWLTVFWWKRLVASINPFSANFTKLSNTLKQFVGNLPTNCLSVFDYFVGLALKGLRLSYIWNWELTTAFCWDITVVIADQFFSSKTVWYVNPLDTGGKLNVHKTFRRCLGRLLNILCTFNLDPMPRGKCFLSSPFVSSFMVFLFPHSDILASWFKLCLSCQPSGNDAWNGQIFILTRVHCAKQKLF